MSWNRPLAVVLLSALPALSARPAHAADPPAALPSPTPTSTPALTPAAKSFEIGAQIRLRGDAFQNLDLSGARDDRDAYALSRVRLSATLRRGESLSAFVELQDARVFGGETSTVSNEKNVDLHQGWLKVGGEKRFVRLGRQELAYGEQRLVGTFDWDNVGRAFDGVLGRAPFFGGKLSVDAFAAKVKESPAAPERNDVDFGGLYATWKLGDAVGLDGYVLVLRNGERNAAGDDRVTDTFGVRAFGKSGGFSYDLEGAYQVGHDFANDRRAWAFAGWARYGLGGPLAPTFGFEWSRATGDGKPSDGKAKEFDNLFPTNHLKYGFLDLLGLRNNRMLGLSAQLSGSKVKWTARVVGRLLAVDDPAGAWKSAGGVVLGQDPTGTSGRRIGSEVDVILSAPLLPGLVGHVQAGWLAPGGFAKKVRGGDDAYGGAAYLVFTF